ncbi:hypothetical protein C8J56DRAFT_953140 [Mycena floridula]|nr:hypothetical protein C8J56DRAFT_953140 [Mycena floridula]
MLLTEDHETLLGLDLEPSSDEYRGECQRSCTEFVWVNLQLGLEEAGYRLRPRYRRDWKPSWLPGERLAGQPSYECEDGLSIGLCWAAIDAIRVKDGQKVVLKITFNHTKEQDISQTFSEPPFRNNPQNHCVPGLKFMHDQNIAHRDISRLNIMMTGSHVIPSEHHFSSYLPRYSLESGLLVPCKPKQHLCKVSPVQYFFIDFGLSDKYPDGQEQARTTGIVGQTKATPELSDDVPYNPFKSDIVQLGTVFKKMFPLSFPDLHDFGVLMDRMTETKWEDRPGAKEALELFEDIVSSMPAERQTALIPRKWSRTRVTK